MNLNQSSIIARPHIAHQRNIKKVPFVELYLNRLQGVVSSSSDIKRVYVSFIERKTLNFYCSTNNNRPCGGLRGSPCKHIQLMVKESIIQFGAIRVAQFLNIEEMTPTTPSDTDIIKSLSKGKEKREPANAVFSRFLHYLRYFELEQPKIPIPEMSWFV